MEYAKKDILQRDITCFQLNVNENLEKAEHIKKMCDMHSLIKKANSMKWKAVGISA